MLMPQQKPGRSKQDWQTPPELLTTIKQRLHIENFVCDVAATKENSVGLFNYSLEVSGLEHGWDPVGWNWCNPPFGDIAPWVSKAIEESKRGCYTAMLVPLSLSKWWLEAEQWAYILYLNGRITFVGAIAPYPKDCALLLFTPMRLTGGETWSWKD